CVGRVCVSVGSGVRALDLLDEPRDVFYLEVNELLGFVEGTTTTTDLKALVALRKSEFARYRTEDAPSDRFETRGMVHHGHAFAKVSRRLAAGERDQRPGLSRVPGTARATR